MVKGDGVTREEIESKEDCLRGDAMLWLAEEEEEEEERRMGRPPMPIIFSFNCIRSSCASILALLNFSK